MVSGRSEHLGAATPAREPVSSRDLRVVEVNPESDGRWEAFIRSHPDATVYHHPAWLATLEREYHRPSAHLACIDSGGHYRGVLPLLYTRGLPFNVGGHLTARRLTSLPRTPAAGPLADEQAAAGALVAAAVERARGQDNVILQIKPQGPELDGLVDELVAVPWRMSYLLQLPTDPARLRFGDSRNHGRIKWAVNKAAKLGVKIRAAETIDDLRCWYKLYLETMQSHLVPPRPFRLFRAMWDLLRPAGLLRLLLAERRAGGTTTVLAGSIFLMFGRTVFYAFNGSKRELLGLRPNDVIQWKAIHDTCSEGFARYDLGEVVGDNTGLADFKKKWGADGQRLYRYYWPAPRTAGRSDREAGGSGRRVAHRAWRLLPPPVTALVGDGVYAFL